MDKNNMPAFELWALLIGELICSAIVCAVYAIVGAISADYDFSYNVITGALLGTLVIFLNFFFLSLSTAKVFREAKEARGDNEMSDEEVDAFVKEHQNKYNTMVRVSFLIRNVTMLLTLIGAFLLPDVFDVIATLVPLIAYRPILSLTALIQNKRKG